MESMLIGIAGVVGLLLAIALGIHVGISLGLVGLLGIWGLTGSLTMGFGIIATTSFIKVTTYAFTCLPLFILMGEFAVHGGLSDDLFNTAHKWVGRLPGGLAVATILGNAAFGTVTGSSAVSITVFTKMALPQMLKHNYSKQLATGAILGGGMLGMLIPPSMLMVVYGIITELSIGHLLMAGIGPGLLLTAMYSVQCYVMVRLKPSLAPVPGEAFSLKEKIASLKGIAGTFIIALIIIGGMYSGIFSPTEAGAAGAFATLILALGIRRLSVSKFSDSILETTRTTAMLFLIVMCAVVFARFLTLSTIPAKFAEWVIATHMPPMAMVGMFMVMYLVLGCVLDSVSMMFITLPIVHPIIVHMGLDPIWFAMLVIMAIECGLLTPPVGLNVYILKAAAPEDTDLGELFVAALPFCLIAMAAIVIMMYAPQISVFIPNHMFG